MEWMNILYAALVIGGLGLVFGVGLGIAAKKFAIELDPLFPIVRDFLPGANCGGCGYAGCDAFAKALVAGEGKPNGCPVNNNENMLGIASALGIEAKAGNRIVSFVKCNGTCDNAKDKYEYYGIHDCQSASYLQGTGAKGCEYGCLGFGSCVKACMFDAITVVDGVAVVNEEKCTACGMCVKACPKAIIEIVPEKSPIRVRCNSRDKGKDVKAKCSVGCIACSLCVKACESDAIHVTNQLSKIDYEKCINCGKCVAKCPTKAIVTSK